MKQTATRDIIWLFVATRLILIILTYIAYILLTAPKYSSTPVDTVAFFATWNHWDAANYVRIAQYGYQSRFDLAFFPLFPFLIACISSLLGSWSYLLVGTLISNAALLGVLFLLYRLAADVAGDQVAHRTLLYLCIFPTALFFFAAYNESLFLLFITGTFLALRRKRWWLAGILGLLATLTRSAGILLAIPYLYEMWIARESVLVTRRKAFLAIFPVCLIPMGIVIYGIYCWHIFGDPLAFVHAQDHWGRHLAWPWQGIFRSISDLFFYHQRGFGSSDQAHILLDLTATLGFLLLMVVGRRKLRVSYSLWMGFHLLYILLYPALDKPNDLLSNQRFVLEMFPAFITLAILSTQRPRLHQTLILIFPALLAIFSIAFLMNHWMV